MSILCIGKRRLIPWAVFVWIFYFASIQILAEEPWQEFTEATVNLPASLDAVEQRVIALLQQRLRELGVTLLESSTSPSETSSKRLNLYWGRYDAHPDLSRLAEQHGIAPPDRFDPGPEGYRLVMVLGPNGPCLLAVTADRRGMLYAIGELLRQSRRLSAGIRLPSNLDVRGVARWPIRGTIASQGHTITELTGSRPWTMEERQRNIEEYALAGANTFELAQVGPEDTGFQFIKSLGLDALVCLVGNVGSGPEEWQAVEAIGRKGYLCPSIPEARQSLVEQNTARMKQMAPFDYVHWKSGDGGGCECDQCRPYGQPFIKLCEELTQILHQVHPKARAFVGNQKLDNSGDQAILRHFQQHLDSRIEGIVLGPGSNAMGWMPGRRQDHRMDLFPYSGMGQVDRYLMHLVSELPPQRKLLFFTDLTHWVYSQYGLMDHDLIADRDGNLPPQWDRWMYEVRPDPAMQQVYDRRTFHARPRAYHRIFQHVMRYGLGDVTYSEGHHDQFNQWMWQRLMWDPHQSAEQVVAAYCQYHFGPQAAETMSQAIFLLEENLTQPIANNPGIDRLIELVELAGHQMPPEYHRSNYLWLQYLQRGLVDKIIQLQVISQSDIEQQVLRQLEIGLKTGRLVEAVHSASNILSQAVESRTIMQLRQRTDQIGQQSDALFGVRNEGLFNLDQDFVGLGWLRHEIGKAREMIHAMQPSSDADGVVPPDPAQTASRLQQLVQRIAHYEDPGPGGYYDDLGNPQRSPHLVHGLPYGDGGFSDSNRPSQRRMAFTTDDQRGVTLRYRDLDPSANYRVRMTLVRPQYKQRFALWHSQTRQSIFADDVVLCEDLELPEHEAEFFEFDIPHSVTSDGELELRFQKQKGIGEGPESQVTVWRNTGGWGTLVSEVWLVVSSKNRIPPPKN